MAKEHSDRECGSLCTPTSASTVYTTRHNDLGSMYSYSNSRIECESERGRPSDASVNELRCIPIRTISTLPVPQGRRDQLLMWGTPNSWLFGCGRVHNERLILHMVDTWVFCFKDLPWKTSHRFASPVLDDRLHFSPPLVSGSVWMKV